MDPAWVGTFRLEKFMAGFEASREVEQALPPVPEEPSYGVADLCGAWRVETRSHKVREERNLQREPVSFFCLGMSFRPHTTRRSVHLGETAHVARGADGATGRSMPSR